MNAASFNTPIPDPAGLRAKYTPSCDRFIGLMKAKCDNFDMTTESLLKIIETASNDFDKMKSGEAYVIREKGIEFEVQKNVSGKLDIVIYPDPANPYRIIEKVISLTKGKYEVVKIPCRDRHKGSGTCAVLLNSEYEYNILAKIHGSQKKIRGIQKPPNALFMHSGRWRHKGKFYNESMDATLKRSLLTDEEKVLCFFDCLSGLVHLEKIKMIAGDIKPGNIFRKGNKFCLADFGGSIDGSKISLEWIKDAPEDLADLMDTTSFFCSTNDLLELKKLKNEIISHPDAELVLSGTKQKSESLDQLINKYQDWIQKYDVFCLGRAMKDILTQERYRDPNPGEDIKFSEMYKLKVVHKLADLKLYEELTSLIEEMQKPIDQRPSAPEAFQKFREAVEKSSFKDSKLFEMTS